MDPSLVGLHSPPLADGNQQYDDNYDSDSNWSHYDDNRCGRIHSIVC